MKKIAITLFPIFKKNHHDVMKLFDPLSGITNLDPNCFQWLSADGTTVNLEIFSRDFYFLE